jgi:hypothetical protein
VAQVVGGLQLMAWSWSHTQEAYDYARSQVYEMKRNELLDIAAEWRTFKRCQEKYPDVQYSYEMPYTPLGYKRKFNANKRYIAAFWSTLEIAEYVWECMSEAATCDNGGWNAWVDPEGYVTVPFSPPEE